MTKKINVGIIGCGMIAKIRHIPALKKMNDKVNLCAVCDLNAQLASETAKEFNITNAYSNVSEMFLKEKFDLVDICVPPHFHAPVALEAIENDCSVTMEKPMALKVADCEKIISAAKKHKVKLCVGHNNLFHPPFIEAKKMVKQNAIGEVIGMRIFLSTPRWHMIDLKDHWYHKLPGGVIGETGPHMAYMTMEFLNDIFNVEVFAKNILNNPWAPFDDFRIELEGKNGLCSTTISYSTNYWAAEIDILGTDAFLRIDLEHMNLVKYNLKKQDNVALGKSTLDSFSQTFRSLISNTVNVTTGTYKLGTDYVIEKVVDCILDDTKPPVSGEEGKEAVRIMEMVVDNYQQKYRLTQ
jgi:predicted dehydrogenase